jgi:hypothetical protein
MRHSLLLAGLLLFCFYNNFAQTPLKHDKKIFISPNGKYYINKSLPVYMSFTLSTDPKAEHYQIKSDLSPANVYPFYFNTDGQNHVKLTALPDANGNLQPVYADFYIDGTPPLTRHNLIAPAEFTAADNTKVYGKGMSIEITSTDETSGAEKIYYSVNKEPFKAYSTILKFEKDGNFDLKYYSVDNVGNVDAVKNIIFIVDLTPPKSTCKLDGPKINEMVVISAQVNLVIDKTDNLSGCQKSMYYFDDPPFQAYTGAISCNKLIDGKHKIVFYSIDNVGNTEVSTKPENSVSFYLDRIAPEVEITIEGDQYLSPGETFFISPKTKIKLTAKDNFSGLDKIMYAIKANSTLFPINEVALTEYKTPFSLSEKGIQDISVQATDKIGNIRQKLKTVYLDNMQPKTGIKYGRPQYFNSEDNNLCITKATEISLFTTVYHSGIKETKVGIDADPEKAYSGPFKIESEGKRKIKYYSVNNVNTAEVPSLSFVVVDNTPPTVDIKFPDPPIQKTFNGKSYNTYKPKSRMYLECKDNLCGIDEEKIFFTINDGLKLKYKEISSAVMEEYFVDENLYRIKTEVYDKLGNSTSKTFEFLISK